MERPTEVGRPSASAAPAPGPAGQDADGVGDLPPALDLGRLFDPFQGPFESNAEGRSAAVAGPESPTELAGGRGGIFAGLPADDSAAPGESPRSEGSGDAAAVGVDRSTVPAADTGDALLAAPPSTGPAALAAPGGHKAGGPGDGLAFGGVALLSGGSVGDRVWLDADFDGIQDEGEKGLAGVTVKLLDSKLVLLQSTATDGNGNYAFGGLNAGSYTVEFVPLTGYQFSPKDQGGNDALDSDADSKGRTAPFMLSTGGHADVDAGMRGAVVTVTATDPTASEGGPDTALFTVTRSGGDFSQALTVSYSLGGTADYGPDYSLTPTATSVTIPAGQASATITLTAVDDTEAEPTESVLLTLAEGAGYTVGSPASAAVSILDNEPPVVSITATDPDAAEAGPDSGTFTVTRLGSLSAALTVSYTVSGTAAAGGDYQALSGSVVISAGAASAPVVVTPLDDSLVEWRETVVATLTAGAGYQVSSPSTASVTISDDDEPNFTWTDVSPQPPVLTSPGSQTSAEGSSVSLQISGNDPGNQSLSYAAVNLPLGLVIDSATGLITGTIDYRAAQFDGGHYTPTVILVNALGASTSATFDWWVSNTNRLPTLDPVGTQSTPENGSPWLTLTGSDPDGELLSFGATGLPPGLLVDAETGWVLGTVDANALTGSPYTVSASATDGIDTVTQTFQWVVTTAPPSADLVLPQRHAEGDSVSLQIVASDPHGATLSYSAVNLPPGLSINSSTGLISGTISAGAAQDAPYATLVDISNGPNGVARVIPWTVRHVFVTNPGDQTTLGGASVSLQVQARDPQNDPLTYSATGLPAGLSINTNTGLISGTVSGSAVQGLPYTVTVSAGDGTHSDSQTFAWTVTHSANVAPSLVNPGNRTSHVDEMVSLQLQASDPEQDLLTYSATGLPAGIGIDAATGLISGQLYDDSYSPSFSVTVTADDGHGGVTSQTFNWSFALPNLSGTPATVSAVQGAEFSDVLVATFTDLQAGAPSDGWPYSATINWGDGTTSEGIIDGANNNFQVFGSHTYTQAGTFTVAAIVTQGNLGSVTINSTANVSNPALTATALAPNFTLDDPWSVPIAVFDDPNTFGATAGYSATVTWGGGSPVPATVYGTAGKFVVYASGSFAQEGAQPFTVLISDNEGSTVSVSGSATVGELAVGEAATLTTSLYGALNGYPPPSGYTATIDWGDGSGSENGVINPSGTTLTVSGTHRYTAAGTYTVTVNATSPLGETRTDTSTVTVVRQPIQVFREVIETTVGEALSNTQVGVVVDPNNALSGAPSIDWGDGTSSAGTLVGGNGLYRLLGSKTYAASGTYLVFAGGDPQFEGAFRRIVQAGLLGGLLGAAAADAAPKADPSAPKKGEKAVHKGTIKWELTAPDPKGADAKLKIQFVPSKDNPATVITFLQVVREDTLDGKPTVSVLPKAEREFREKSNVDKNKFDYIDMFPDDTDPYTGAEWDGAKWKPEISIWKVGNGPKQEDAETGDWPDTKPIARKGKVTVVRFEIAVFSVDSQEILGVIQWGFKVPGDKDGKTELLGATMADVSLGASAEFKKVIEKANTMPELKHAQLDGKPKITKPNAKKFGGTSALPD